MAKPAGKYRSVGIRDKPSTSAVKIGVMAFCEKLEVVDSTQQGPLAAALAQSTRWYAVHTVPCNEERAEWHLRRQCFKVFLPKRRKSVRHARKTSMIDAPFFPQYLFVALDLLRDRWREVNRTYGVSRLVMSGERPQPVPRGVVEALIASTDAGGTLHLERHLRVGEPVRLLAGPFAEQLAVLNSLDDAGRVRVLLDMFGRQVAMTTSANSLLPLS